MEEEYRVTSSLRQTALSNIEAFLYNEKFISCSNFSKGILELINFISDYYEEGVHLYPEVIITNNIELLEKTIPSRQFVVKTRELSIDGFKEAIKLCSPLAINGWVIFIEVSDEHSMKFGLITSEITETSLSLYKQTIEDQEPIDYINIAYIKNLGKKTVELVGLKKSLIVSLTLDDHRSVLNNEITQLSNIISSKCSEDSRIKIATYFEKIINEAIKIGHGNLIGVINDDENEIANLKIHLSDGIYLEKPIDFEFYISTVEESKNEESSIALRQYATILTAMLNHDGITLLTNKGKVLGYHLFVKSENDGTIVGGARTRAFKAMQELKLVACFYKSQDGNVKYYTYE